MSYKSQEMIYLLKEEQINTIANLKWQITKCGFKIEESKVIVFIEYIGKDEKGREVKKMINI